MPVRFVDKIITRNLSFVPKHKPHTNEDVIKLVDFLKTNKIITVITGAGISTESGIPDYRSEDVGLYARSNHKPTQYNEFLKSSYMRQRYWARNYVAWPRFSSFEPNIIHKTLTKMERDGKISCIITQNVDHLHSKAGSRNVIELHGTSYRVMCLGCPNIVDRESFQHVLSNQNPFMKATSDFIRPDGDVDLNDEDISSFVVPQCESCGGILKPDVVFFGDNVPKLRTIQVSEEVSKSSAILILGSSLSTFSAYRIILQCKEEKKPLAIVNIGKTRADKDVDLKISTKCGDIMPEIYDKLYLN